MMAWIIRRFRYWPESRKWGAKCDVHGFEVPCEFHAHNPLGLYVGWTKGWALPYKKAKYLGR